MKGLAREHLLESSNVYECGFREGAMVSSDTCLTMKNWMSLLIRSCGEILSEEMDKCHEEGGAVGPASLHPSASGCLVSFWHFVSLLVSAFLTIVSGPSISILPSFPLTFHLPTNLIPFLCLWVSSLAPVWSQALIPQHNDWHSLFCLGVPIASGSAS